MTLDQLSHERKTLKQAADELRRYFGTGEINFKVADKAAAMQTVERAFPGAAVDHLDGVTLTFPDWWVNVRPSNTEPYLRMCLEANTAELRDQRKRDLIALLGPPAAH
jgi:phosphomannomutase